jgi:hypothetical protein
MRHQHTPFSGCVGGDTSVTSSLVLTITFEEAVMYALLFAARIATETTGGLARSALPDAPTVDDHPVRAPGPVRRGCAAALRRLADRLASEPVPSPAR